MYVQLDNCPLINQDINDLFGADLPVEGQQGVHFAWRDGPFLRALKNGHWILLDEVLTIAIVVTDNYEEVCTIYR